LFKKNLMFVMFSLQNISRNQRISSNNTLVLQTLFNTVENVLTPKAKTLTEWYNDHNCQRQNK